MDFSKSKSKILKKTFDYVYIGADGAEASEPITIEFYEKCLTPAFLDSLTQYEAKKDSVAIAKHISRNLVSWSLTWNGEAFPPSVENLTEVCDFDFLMQIVTAISETFGGKKPTPTVSQNGSEALAKSEPAAAN